VSRYETFARMPSVATVFAYEILFRTAACDLFAGAYEDVRRTIVGRAKILMETLTEADQHESACKLEFLRAIVEGDTISGNSQP